MMNISSKATYDAKGFQYLSILHLNVGSVPDSTHFIGHNASTPLQPAQARQQHHLHIFA
jgi:hypothetical protein